MGAELQSHSTPQLQPTGHQRSAHTSARAAQPTPATPTSALSHLAPQGTHPRRTFDAQLCMQQPGGELAGSELAGALAGMPGMLHHTTDEEPNSTHLSTADLQAALSRAAAEEEAVAAGTAAAAAAAVQLTAAAAAAAAVRLTAAEAAVEEEASAVKQEVASALDFACASTSVAVRSLDEVIAEVLAATHDGRVVNERAAAEAHELRMQLQASGMEASRAGTEAATAAAVAAASAAARREAEVRVDSLEAALGALTADSVAAAGEAERQEVALAARARGKEEEEVMARQVEEDERRRRTLEEGPQQRVGCILAQGEEEAWGQGPGARARREEEARGEGPGARAQREETRGQATRAHSSDRSPRREPSNEFHRLRTPLCSPSHSAPPPPQCMSSSAHPIHAVPPSPPQPPPQPPPQTAAAASTRPTGSIALMAAPSSQLPAGWAPSAGSPPFESSYIAAPPLGWGGHALWESPTAWKAASRAAVRWVRVRVRARVRLGL